MKTVALVGCPNTGKTSLFNILTGSRQKVANYAGVTVERREGFLRDTQGETVRVLDLPGVRGTAPRSRDEAITWEVLKGKGQDRVDSVIAVVDATELERTLPLVLELRALGLPMVVAVNMMDLAEKRGLRIDLKKLSDELGVAAIRCSALKGEGIRELVVGVDGAAPTPEGEALGVEAASRAATQILQRTIVRPIQPPSGTDRLDGILLHRVWGPLFGIAVFFTVFQAVFTVAAPFQDGIESGVAWAADQVSGLLGPGPFRDLIVDGAMAGVGAVLVFLPQILLLFLCISILEDTGYLARAAFLLDRAMRALGLSGQTFLPLLSSFACAIPGIMATRTIEGRRHRWTAILMAPLMACSARLPVYTLLIAAFIPNVRVGGWVGLQGLVMLGLYLLGILGAIAIAWVGKRLGRTEAEMFLLELPTYKTPSLRNVALALVQRGGQFVKRAGTTIFAISVALWFLVSYPKASDGTASLEHSWAGKIGSVLAPALEPVGFDWRISVALVPGLAAREVMVGALGTVFAVENGDGASEEASIASLGEILTRNYSLATALALLVWYVFAPQCLATFAVVRRETGSLRFAGLSIALFFAMAYVGAWVTYQLVRWVA